MKQTNKRNYFNNENNNSTFNSLLWFIVILFAILYMLLSGFTTIYKNNKDKIVDKIEQVCPKCDGIIKFINPPEYDINVNIDIEDGVIKIKLPNGQKVDFEKVERRENDGFLDLTDRVNRNKGLKYTYDINTDKYIYQGVKYDKVDFIKKLNEDTKFEFELPKDEKVEDITDNLEICLEDIIIDLGGKKITRTYNIKLTRWTIIISFEDYVNVIDSSITPVAYFGEELLSENEIMLFEPRGDKELNLKEKIIDKITYLDLDNTIKIPSFEIIQSKNIISEDYIVDWFNEELTTDYSAVLVVTYTDLMGVDYEERVGIILSELYEPIYKGLYPKYIFNVGEYERVIPSEIYLIENGERVDISSDIVIDDSNVNENEVGSYEVYYKYKSKYSNMIHTRKVTINIVE